MENKAVFADGNAVVATEGAHAVGKKAKVGLIVEKDAKVGDVKISFETGMSSKQDWKSSKVHE